MKRYFKREAESELGAVRAYPEITNGWSSRQVEVYGATWQWGDEAHPEHEHLANLNEVIRIRGGAPNASWLE